MNGFPRPRVIARGLCILTLTAVGCGRLAPIPDAFPIGHITPRTGPEQAEGAACSEAAAMAVNDLNSSEANRINVHTLVVIHADAGDQVDGFAFQATRLTAVNRVPALIGGTRRDQLEKLAPIALSSQRLIVSPCGGPAIPGNRLTWCIGLDASDRGRALAAFLAEKPPDATVVIVQAASALHRALADAFANEYRHADRKMIGEWAYSDRKELADLAAKLSQSPATGIAFFGKFDDLLVLRAALPTEKIASIRWLLGSEEDEAGIIRAIDRCDGLVFASAFAPDDKRPATEEFVSKYRSRTKLEPTADAAMTAEALRILHFLGKKANDIDPKKILAELDKPVEYDGLAGPVRLQDRIARRTAYIRSVQAREIKLEKSYPAVVK